MNKRLIGASILFGACLGCFTVAAAQLPADFMVDRYLLRADRLMAGKDPKAALDMMNKIIDLQQEHNLTLPGGFHFRHAEVALSAGSFQDAIDASSKHLLEVGRAGHLFSEALGLLDDAEQLQIWVGTRQTCAGQSKGAECWMEVSGQPACYVWNPDLRPGETVAWSGECSRGQAQGKGTLKQVWEGGNKISSTELGSLREGKKHGQWVEYLADGTYHQGSYVEGKKHGHWNVLAAGGNSRDGSYVEGKKHGRWTERQVDGTYQQGSYVAGRRHGRWRVHQTDGTIHEGPYVAGKRHGRWVIREGGMEVDVHFYVNGDLAEKE